MRKRITIPLSFLFLICAEAFGTANVSEIYPIGSDHFVRIAEKAKNSVVTITLTRTSEPQKGRGRLLIDKILGKKRSDDLEDFFSFMLFQEYPQREFLEKMIGSGIILQSDGLILTNDHVTGGGQSLEVILPDGRIFSTQIIGRDYLTDIAVLKIEATDLPVARLGDSDHLRVGEWVLAIGNSLGLRYTVSAGIVSAKGRYLGGEGWRSYANMLQTDAAINFGNSGGPLLDMKGEVVGINTSIIPAGQSMGFATPINEIKKILPDLIQKGEVLRPWLGFILDQKNGNEFVISRLVKNGPAERAGVRIGDKILSFNGTELKTPKEIPELIKKMGVGSQLSMLVERDGQTLPVALVTENMPIPDLRGPKIYPPGFEGFILRLPTGTRWLLITGSILFVILLLSVQRDMNRKSKRPFQKRGGERREKGRRAADIPFEEIKVTEERRETDRRHSDRREKRGWL